MRFAGVCLLGLLFAGIDDNTSAQTKVDSQACARAIAPFVDEQTIVVAHVDLSRVDFDWLLEQAAELAPGSEKMLAASVDRIQPMAKRLIESGAKDIYFVVSLADLPQLPFLVVPLDAGCDAEALQSVLAELHLEAVERVEHALFAGGKQALERIKSQTPMVRPEIVRAFEAAGDTAAQLLLLPTADSRRVIEELLPSLPAEVGGGPSKVLTRGAMWAAAGIDFSRQPAIKLTIQSQDREAAAALRDKWVAALELIGRDARLKKAVPQFDEVAAQLEPAVKGDRLQLAVELRGAASKPLAGLLRTGLGKAQESAGRKQTIDHLKRIGIAMHTYLDLHKSFPAAANYDATGKPLLSWRVHILPFLEQQQLYEEFHLDEPWDSEHNRKLIERMPDIYSSTNWSPEQPTETCFVGVTSAAGTPAPGGGAALGVPLQDQLGTMFQGREGVRIQGVTDGTSNTIMVVESDPEHAVIWTKPDDLPFDGMQPTKGLGANGDGFVAALFCDGSVRYLKRSLEPETWRRLFLRNDGNPVPRN